MRAALLLFPVINHQSGKQILQIHPYIHFLYTRIFLFPYPLFIAHSYALLIFYHVLQKPKNDISEGEEEEDY